MLDPVGVEVEYLQRVELLEPADLCYAVGRKVELQQPRECLEVLNLFDGVVPEVLHRHKSHGTPSAWDRAVTKSSSECSGLSPSMILILPRPEVAPFNRSDLTSPGAAPSGLLDLRISSDVMCLVGLLLALIAPHPPMQACVYCTPSFALSF